MSSIAFKAVLLGAILPITWNAVVKNTGAKILTSDVVAASARVLSARALPVLPQPHA